MVQWLRLHASNARGMGLIPGRGTKIPRDARWGRKKKIYLSFTKLWPKLTWLWKITKHISWSCCKALLCYNCIFITQFFFPIKNQNFSHYFSFLPKLVECYHFTALSGNTNIKCSHFESIRGNLGFLILTVLQETEPIMKPLRIKWH